MTWIISPEDRERWGLAPDDPGPVSLPKMQIRPDHTRKLERQGGQSAQLNRSIAKRGASNQKRPSSDDFVESARRVLDKAALGADMAVIGLAAGGVTAPVASAAEGLKIATELGLGGVNLYDAWKNDNWGPLKAQGASLPARLIPGGRILKKTLKTLRGPTGPLRNSAGRFRSSILNNKGIEEAGQTATERYVGNIADILFDR